MRRRSYGAYPRAGHAKGGVGKTTTTLSLGVARVLLIDIDPQANLSLGVDPAEVEYSIYEVLPNPDQGTAFATLSTESGVDLIPSTLALAGAELSWPARSAAASTTTS